MIFRALHSFATDPLYRYRAMGWLRRHAGLHGRTSYSQAGEDLILRAVFDTLRVPSPTYVDIGANHPVRLSNTFYFYRAGSRGVCIEPDPSLAKRIRSRRPRDLVLNVGVGTAAGDLDFHVMSQPVLNTFSVSEARNLERLGHRVVRTLRVPIVTVAEVLDRWGQTPDFVNIDAEGLDLEIARAFDLNAQRPAAFCVETITYAEDGTGRKIPEIFELFESNDYFAYADTYVNTIFVDRRRWGRLAAGA